MSNQCQISPGYCLPFRIWIYNTNAKSVKPRRHTSLHVISDLAVSDEYSCGVMGVDLAAARFAYFNRVLRRYVNDANMHMHCEIQGLRKLLRIEAAEWYACNKFSRLSNLNCTEADTSPTYSPQSRILLRELPRKLNCCHSRIIFSK